VAEPLSLGQLGRVLLRYWVLILVGTLLGGTLAFGVTRFMTPVYRATAIQLVKGLPGTGAAANYEAAQYAVSRAKTYPSFVHSLEVLEGVRRDMGNTQSIVQLREDLSATNPVETPLLEITASAPTRAEAQEKANSAARHMARFITQIETVGNRSPIAVETAVEAAPPINAASPKTLVIAALGALMGFALATIIALINSYVRYQRRSAFRRKQAIGWVSGEPAGTALAAPADARESPESERQVTVASDSPEMGLERPAPEVSAVVERERSETTSEGRPDPEVSVVVERERSETTSEGRPDPEVSAVVERERSETTSEGQPDPDEFLLMEIDPDPTTEMKRTGTPEAVIEEFDDATIERFGPVDLAESGNSAKQTDVDAVHPNESADSVDLDRIETANPDDSGDAAAGSAEEPDDAEAFEHSGVWKQSARR
jgi:capsular polysaccharide biosynthesis protein